MKVSQETRLEIIQEVVAGKFDQGEAAERLAVTTRTIRRYKACFIKYGAEGLKDNRTGNNHKLTSRNKQNICKLKKEGPWRSARFIRDKLSLPVHEQTVWRVLVENDLTHLNAKRLKPYKRFVAFLASSLALKTRDKGDLIQILDDYFLRPYLALIFYSLPLVSKFRWFIYQYSRRIKGQFLV